MTDKAVPFKRSLLVNLTVVVATLGLALLAISLVVSDRTVKRLSGVLTDQVIATTDAQVMRFFEPIFSAIEIAAKQATDGDFEEFPIDRLDNYFEPVIERMPQISSIMYAHANGDEYMLLQSQGNWQSRLSRPESHGNQQAVREWRDPTDTRSQAVRTIDYDARTRPWFQGALQRLEDLGPDAPLRDRIHWTVPYRFFTTNEPGMTASLAFRMHSGTIAILGFDVLLADISRFTSQLHVGNNGKVFVVRGDPVHPDELVIVGLPADERFDTQEAMLEFILSSPGEFGGPVASLVQSAMAASEAASGGAVQFPYEDEDWWGEITKSELRTSDAIWVGSVVPERELLASLPNTRLIVIVVTALVLLLAVYRAMRLARRYSEPVEELTERGSRMQRLNFEPVAPVDSDIAEIRHLSATLERMRSALHSYTASREDLRIAGMIHEQNLPRAVPAPPGLRIDVWHQPSEELGGECYDAIAGAGASTADGSDEPVTLGLFDFPGTGLAAAIGGSQLRSEFRAAAAAGTNLVDIAERLERFVVGEQPGLSPLRACLLTIHPDRRIEFLSLGWDDIVFRGAEGAQRIGPAGGPVGLTSEPITSTPRDLRLASGDCLVIASDGILDAIDASRQRFGIDGLVRAVTASDGDAVSGRVRKALASYAGGMRGDRTLVVIDAHD
jgi:serine phosphatase RsbU (regulator of sigma subunit)